MQITSLVSGFMLGVALVAFFWLLKSTYDQSGVGFNNEFLNFEILHQGKILSPRKAHRICSKLVEKTSPSGKYYGCLVSLWKSYYGGFFLLDISETSQPIIVPIIAESAEIFVLSSTPDRDEAIRIINSWFSLGKKCI